MVKKEKTQIRNIKNEKVNNRCYSVKMIESLCCPPETITTLLIGYTPIQNKSLKKQQQQQKPSLFKPEPNNFSETVSAC